MVVWHAEHMCARHPGSERGHPIAPSGAEAALHPAFPLNLWQSTAFAVAIALVVSVVIWASSWWTSREATKKTAGCGSLYLAVFLDSFGAFMVMPQLPLIAYSLHATAKQVGWMASGFCAAQFVGTAVLGVLSDYFPRRFLVISTLFVCSLALIFCGLATNIYMLTATRVIAGFFASTVSLCQTMVIDRSTDEDRVANVGILQGVFTLGVVAGPIVGGATFNLGFPAMCFAAGAITQVNVVYAVIQLCVQHDDNNDRPPGGESIAPLPGPEPAAAEAKAPAPAPQNSGGSGPDPVMLFCRTVLQRPALAALLICALVNSTAVGILAGISAYFALEEFGIGPEVTAIFFLIYGLQAVLAQFFAVERIQKRLGDAVTIWVMTCIKSTMMVLYVTIPYFPTQVIGMFVLGWTDGILWPSVINAISVGMPKETQGTANGVMQAARSLGEAIGPVLGGMMYEQWICEPMWVSAVMMFIGGMIYCPRTDRKAKPQDIEEPLLKD